jgi:hypothetical protein
MQAALDIQKNVDIMQHKTNEIMTDGSVIWAAWLLVLILGGGGDLKAHGGGCMLTRLLD